MPTDATDPSHEPRTVLDRLTDGVLSLDSEWRIRYANPPAAALLGRPTDALLGAEPFEVVPALADAGLETAIRNAAASGDPATVEVTLDEAETRASVRVHPGADGLTVTIHPAAGGDALGADTDSSVTDETLPSQVADIEPPGSVDGVEEVFGPTEELGALRGRERGPEHDRSQLDSELVEILERVSDAFFALDRDWNFTYVNEQAADLIGHTVDELEGEYIWDMYPGAVGTPFQSSYERAMNEQETVSFEEYYPPLDAWFEVNAYPSESGLSVYFDDVTEREQRERELERYRTIVETMDDGVYVVEDGQFTMVNDAYTEMTGRAEADLLGSHVSEVVDESVVERARDVEAELERDGVTAKAVEAPIERPDGSTIQAEARFALIEGGDRTERLGVVRDVTERKQRERDLERGLRQQRLLSDLERAALEGADLDDLFEEATASVAEMLGSEYCGVFELVDADERLELRAGVGWADELVGTAAVGTDATSLPGYTLEAADPVVVDDFTEEPRFDAPHLFTDHGVVSGVSVAIGPPSDPWGMLAVHDTSVRTFGTLDVSFVQNVAYALETAIDRLEYERELKRYEVFTEESTDVNAIYDPDGTLRYVTPSVETILGYTPDEVVGRNIFDMAHPDERDQVRAVFDTLLESPETTQTIEMRLRRRSGDTRVVEASARNLLDEPLLEGIVTYTRDVTERKQRERALREQRDQLSALAQLNAVVREVNTALVESSSREELVRRVCERLVAADPYLFAWVAELDTTASEFVPRTSAGPHDDYLEEISVPYADGDDCGPICRAFRTGEMQVAHTRTEQGDEAGRDDALARGFRASAAIPIVHGDRQYGVLSVYTGRENAFDDREREVVSNLGETLGHAISSLERKAALMADTVTELELSIPGLGALVEDAPGDADPTITVERTLDTGDGVYVVYISTDGLSEAGIRSLFGQADDRLLSIRRLDDGDDEDGRGAYEVRVTDPVALSTVRAYGGSLREMAVRGNDLALLFELPLEENVRRFVDRVSETYPDASLVRQKQVQREARSQVEYVNKVAERLTEKQYQTLETAYFAGYYEWPRRSSASEVADALSVSDSTISQHFRAAHRKLCSVLFEG